MRRPTSAVEDGASPPPVRPEQVWFLSQSLFRSRLFHLCPSTPSRSLMFTGSQPRPHGHDLTSCTVTATPTTRTSSLSFFSFSSLFSLSFFLSFSSFFSSWLWSPFLSFSLLFSDSVILYNYLFQLAICFFINSLFIHCFSTSTLCFCQFNTLLVHSTLCVYVTINHFLFNYFGLLS